MGGETHATFTMAALMASGGIMGYLRKGSMPSLVAGVTLGAGFTGAAMLLKQGQMTQGHGSALLLSAVTMSAMGVRAIRGKKPLPIAVSTIGALSTAYHAQRFMDWVGQE